MLIRSAVAVDIPAVLPMVSRMCALHEQWDAEKFGFLPHPEQHYKSWLVSQIHHPKSVFLVAEATSAETRSSEAEPPLAAYLVATTEREIPIYRLQEYGFIHDLWVEPDYRRCGLARQLVQEAIAQFHQMGIHQIRLDVAAANDTARKLFQSVGFRISTTEMLREEP
jgi:ribosomal protein S18 acetylase RimI-like enzyme